MRRLGVKPVRRSGCSAVATVSPTHLSADQRPLRLPARRWHILIIHGKNERMTRLALLAVVIASIPSWPAVATSLQYECQSDMAVGFRFDEVGRRWGPTTFRSTGAYLVRPLTTDERASPVLNSKDATWGVFKPGSSYHNYTCSNTAKEGESPHIACGGIGMNFVLSGSSLRYQAAYLGGYVHGRDDNDDTPFIEAGRCHMAH